MTMLLPLWSPIFSVSIYLFSYREEMLIGVGDIHPDGQHFQIFCQFEQTKYCNKSAIFNLILTTLHRIHGRIVVNACVKYRKPIFIGTDKVKNTGYIPHSPCDRVLVTTKYLLFDMMRFTLFRWPNNQMQINTCTQH